MPIVFRKKIRDLDDPYTKEPAWHNVRKVGRIYCFDKVGEVELFTLGVLAQALARTQGRIRAWEKDGVFPKPHFVIKGDHRRWYSADQVINLHNLMFYKYGCKKNDKFDMKGWVEDVAKVFYCNYEAVDEKGRITLR